MKKCAKIEVTGEREGDYYVLVLIILIVVISYWLYKQRQKFGNTNTPVKNNDYVNVKEKMDMIRNIGINNINIDLMYGIPNESLKDLKKDLDLILKLKPDHISTYSLILEQFTKLSINNIKPIDEELELEMYNYIRKKLNKKKYIHHIYDIYIIYIYISHYYMLYI